MIVKSRRVFKLLKLKSLFFLIIISISTSLYSEDFPRGANGKPDLNGVWGQMILMIMVKIFSLV